MRNKGWHDSNIKPYNHDYSQVIEGGFRFILTVNRNGPGPDYD